MLYIAITAFKDSGESLLNFKRGAVLHVTRQGSGGWWTARRHGKRGHVPKAALREFVQYGVAKAPFEASHEKQLTLRKGEVLAIEDSSEDWWRVRIYNRDAPYEEADAQPSGYVPGNFVTLLRKSYMLERPKIMISCYNYKANRRVCRRLLSIKQGELLLVYDKEDDWLLCENLEGVVGFVTVSFLREVGEDAPPPPEEKPEPEDVEEEKSTEKPGEPAEEVMQRTEAEENVVTDPAVEGPKDAGTEETGATNRADADNAEAVVDSEAEQPKVDEPVVVDATAPEREEQPDVPTPPPESAGVETTGEHVEELEEEDNGEELKLKAELEAEVAKVSAR